MIIDDDHTLPAIQSPVNAQPKELKLDAKKF